MDAERVLTSRVRKSPLSFLPYSSVGRADVIGHCISKNQVDIEHLGQLDCAEIMQQGRTLSDDLRYSALRSCV